MVKGFQNNPFVCVLTCLIVLGAGFDVFAQQDTNEPEDFFDMSIEELLEVPVVVSASRREQKINEASVPTSIITAEDLHYSGLTKIAEILQFAPGVDVLKFNRLTGRMFFSRL